MQNLFRRLWSRLGGRRQLPGAEREFGDVQAWAAARGARFAPARGHAGFVLEVGALRVEWGASQRDYIAPAELRVRAELGDCADLQMMLATKALITALENEVFSQATEGNRTRVDDHTPEEMRWLVLYPKLPRADLAELAPHYGALSNYKRAAAMWLDAPLRTKLLVAALHGAGDGPLVMVVQRNRFVLRRALAAPSVSALEASLALAEAGAASARAVGTQVARGAVSSDPASGWDASSALPPENPPR